MLKKYLDFRNSQNSLSLNENVQQAKTYLRNKALRDKKEKLGTKEGENVGLTAEEVRKADNDSNFMKIRQMLADSPLVYVFTKFFYEDLVELEVEERFNELSILAKRLKDMRSSLSNLPMPVERYVSKAAVDEEKKKSEEEGRQYRNSYERLTDDLNALQGDVATNKWVGQLLSWQKAWFEKLTPFQEEKIKGIANSFDQFGTDLDGTKDTKANKALQDMFFTKVKKYKNLGELIAGAEDFIKSSNNAGFKNFLLAMEKVNKKYGESNGVEEVYSDNGLLIIEVKSFPANKELNANTSHCIAGSPGHWENYVGEAKFTKQYYIYDFNLPSSDIHSIIGITIGEGGRITACHLKNDRSFGTEVVNYLKKKGSSMDLLAPLTKEEIEVRKKRIEASKGIIRDNLSLEEVSDYLEAGANPNAAGGKPLENAVKEDNLEKAKLLLEKGALPSINNPIKFAKNFEMIKLLVQYNCPLTNEVFNSICNDADAVEYVVKNGMDPNFEKGYPLRAAARVGNLDVIKILITNGASVSERRYMVIKQCIENGSSEVLKFLLEEINLEDPNFKNEANRTKLLNDWKHWNTTSLQTKKEDKEEIEKILDSYL